MSLPGLPGLHALCISSKRQKPDTAPETQGGSGSDGEDSPRYNVGWQYMNDHPEQYLYPNNIKRAALFLQLVKRLAKHGDEVAMLANMQSDTEAVYGGYHDDLWPFKLDKLDRNYQPIDLRGVSPPFAANVDVYQAWFEKDPPEVLPDPVPVVPDPEVEVYRTTGRT